MNMQGTPQSHLRTAGSALVNWWRAATLDALIVGALWFIGLELIRVPLAPFWALLGAVLQIIPTFGVAGL
jgi:predicted PurR-regulated permease PerM